jgi:predicted PurR-regulated permease PerM
MEYFWKLAGADPTILRESGEQSQRRFLLIGVLYILVNTTIFLSFFGLFLGVFETFFAGFFGAALMTFVIGNIYRLTLISLEPQTLPIKRELGSFIASMGVRYTVICLFAIFVSKCLETSLFGYLVDQEVALHMKSLTPRAPSNFVYQESSLFLEHMIMLNKHQQWVWGITLVVVMFFLMPVILRAELRKRKEYYSIKRIIDKALVEDFYKNTRSYLNMRYGKLYEQYKDKKMVYRVHEDKYLDPPFNTKLKSERSNIQGSMNDFANLDW